MEIQKAYEVVTKEWLFIMLKDGWSWSSNSEFPNQMVLEKNGFRWNISPFNLHFEDLLYCNLGYAKHKIKQEILCKIM